MMGVVADNPVYSFADFRLDPTRRLLLRNGEIITLHPKAFDLLLALIENRDRVLSKNELLNSVWEGQFVEEGNLAVQIFTLRKIFAEKKDEHRFIVTVPGRGYRFVADVLPLPVGAEPQEGLANVNGEPSMSSNAGLVSFERRSVSRNISSLNGLMYLIFGGLVFAALVASGYFIWHRLSPAGKSAESSSLFRADSIRRLTNRGDVQLAAISPDGRVFAYTTADFERQSMWLGYVEGGEHIELLRSSEVSYHWLAFSSDAGSLLYTASDRADPITTLYKLPVLGGVPEQISKSVSEYLSISPDGAQIAFVRGIPAEKRSGLFVSGLDGGGTRELVSLSRPNAFDFESASWSPDGQVIAFAARIDQNATRQNLYTARVTDGHVEQITDNGWAEIRRTAWLNDGSGLLILAQPFGFWDSVFYEQIWHVSYPAGTVSKVTTDLSNYSTALGMTGKASALLSIEYRQMMNIWVASADDPSHARQVTFSSFGRNDGFTGLAWRPDGKIIYSSTVSNSQVVSLMNADGGDVKGLTPPGFVDSQLSVSGDGRYIFFHSNRSGIFEIWRMDMDGRNLLQMTTGGHNYQSYSSHDGKWVYYKSLQDPIGGLRRISADGGEPQQITESECNWACLSPDGRYLACEYRTDRRRLAIFDISGGQPIRQFEFPPSSLRWYAMHWTPDSKAVAYRDKYYGVWKQPIQDGAQPRRIDGLPKEKIYSFAWSRDGKKFAFTRGESVRDVVILLASE